MLACGGVLFLVMFSGVIVGNILSFFTNEIERMTLWHFVLASVGSLFFGLSALGIGGSFIICNFLENAMVRCDELDDEQRKRLNSLHPCQFSSLHSYVCVVTDVFAEINREKDKAVKLGRRLSKISTLGKFSLFALFFASALVIGLNKYFE